MLLAGERGTSFARFCRGFLGCFCCSSFLNYPKQFSRQEAGRGTSFSDAHDASENGPFFARGTSENGGPSVGQVRGCRRPAFGPCGRMPRGTARLPYRVFCAGAVRFSGQRSAMARSGRVSPSALPVLLIGQLPRCAAHAIFTRPGAQDRPRVPLIGRERRHFSPRRHRSIPGCATTFAPMSPIIRHTSAIPHNVVSHAQVPL